MTDQKMKEMGKVEETLACSAFAEEGVPCPLGEAKKGGAPKRPAGESVLQSVEDDLACAAFGEENEDCPPGICKGKK